NDTTASSGVLFNTLGAPIASSQGPCPVARRPDGTCPAACTTSTPQPAGVVAIQNSSQLFANLPATVTCPAGHYQGTTASNGSCGPPENGGLGYQVPPGIADATVPNPIFNLTPAATVDEGNNWINMSWGPLSMVNPSTNVTLGNYGTAAGSSAINHVPSTA